MRANQHVDLTNCDREPIHIPGAIQPHGVLIACRGETFSVVQVSENCGDYLGVPPAAVLGRPIASLLTTTAADRLMAAASAGFPRELNPLPLDATNGAAFDGIVHASPTPGITIVELEPRGEPVVGFHPSMRASVRQLQGAANLNDLLQTGARELRALTGFDRVMVYRFDRDWNGEVVAEAKLDRLEPFLGLHYPAADIPAQARRLYTLNWLRIIPDAAYTPVALVGSEGGDPIDLSFAVLRSVSPIHLEYLRNMGVTASMSVSLIRDGALIGLIACHHYSGPHHVSFVVRDTAEFLAQAISWHAGALESRAAAERAALIHRAESAVAGAIASARSLPDGLATPALLALTDAQGAAILYEAAVHCVGQTPSAPDIRRIVDALARGDEALHATEKLSDLVDGADRWDDLAAGVLAVEISRELGEYVVWFRPATDRTVDWAGDPRKQEVVDDAGVPRLSPRGSFALWRESVRGRSLPWEPWHHEAALNLRRMLLGGVRRRADELRLLNDRLSDADRVKDEFLATVSHELRTPLNAVLGWTQILRAAETSGALALGPDRRQHALETIERNARAQAQVIDDLLDVSRIVAGKLTLNVQPVDLTGVVDLAIEAIRPAVDAKRIRLQSTLASATTILGDAHRLQQAISNLLSNAVKFTPKDGRVQVHVERRDSSVDVTVADTGQGMTAEFLPHVFERFRQSDGAVSRRTSGLGLGLAIVRHIVELHGGTATAFSEGLDRGSTFTLRFPLSIATRRPSSPSPAVAAGLRRLECPPGLEGLRILVVDDDLDAREMLRALLEECKCVVTVAASATEALQRLDAALVDVIVADIGMPEIDGFTFVEQLRRRPARAGGRIPAIALTAHARVEDRTRALNAGFNSHVPKPVEPMELFAVIASLRPREL